MQAEEAVQLIRGGGRGGIIYSDPDVLVFQSRLTGAIYPRRELLDPLQETIEQNVQAAQQEANLLSEKLGLPHALVRSDSSLPWFAAGVDADRATPAKSILIRFSPAVFAGFNQKERQFLLGHELMHVANGDESKQQNYEDACHSWELQQRFRFNDKLVRRAERARNRRKETRADLGCLHLGIPVQDLVAALQLVGNYSSVCHFKWTHPGAQTRIACLLAAAAKPPLAETLPSNQVLRRASAVASLTT